MAISEKQTRLIHVARRQLGLPDDVYRDILCKVAGVTSSTDLDAVGFTAVLSYFKGQGFTATARAIEFGARRCMATPGQVGYIRHLWAEFTEGRGTDATLGKWLDNKFKVSSLRFVDAETAKKVIAALKNMVARAQSKSREAASA